MYKYLHTEQYSTRKGYHSMLLGIVAFASKDVPFSTITVDWLNKLERFWSNDAKRKSTINVYFKYLKMRHPFGLLYLYNVKW